MSFPMRLALEFNFDLGTRKQMHMFEKKRGAGNEHAGSKGILGGENIKMADAMSVFAF